MRGKCFGGKNEREKISRKHKHEKMGRKNSGKKRAAC
jgi:hypothetical protein